MASTERMHFILLPWKKLLRPPPPPPLQSSWSSLVSLTRFQRLLLDVLRLFIIIRAQVDRCTEPCELPCEWLSLSMCAAGEPHIAAFAVCHSWYVLLVPSQGSEIPVKFPPSPILNEIFKTFVCKSKQFILETRNSVNLSEFLLAAKRASAYDLVGENYGPLDTLWPSSQLGAKVQRSRTSYFGWLVVANWCAHLYPYFLRSRPVASS